jgi:hypothetical protein
MSLPISTPHHFAGDEDGTLSVEAALMLPLYAFAFVAGFSYFDAYRTEAAVTRATYTVADILSRSDTPVGPRDFEGLQDLFEFITHSVGETRLRFTEIRRDGDDLVIVNTYSTDGTEPMTDARLQALRGQIPRLGDGDFITITESFTIHEPLFNVGLVPREIPRLAPTPTRYEPFLAWDFTREPEQVTPPTFEPTANFEPTIPGFDVVALSFQPEPDPVGDGFSPAYPEDPILDDVSDPLSDPYSDGDPLGGDDAVFGGDDDDPVDPIVIGDASSGGGSDGNNGHGNDADGNDDSNPGASNDPDDDTDDDGTPGNGKGGSNGNGNGNGRNR